MKCFKLLIALVLFCTQNGWSIPIDASEKGIQYVYHYKTYTDAGSNANDTRYAKWGLRAEINVQVFDKYHVYQLENATTFLFNGLTEDFTNHSTYEKIPEDVLVYLKPFVLNTEDHTIFVEPNEPLWSVNFKRSIASVFHKMELGKHREKSVFGDCEVETKQGDGRFVKIINHKSCKEVLTRHRTNVNRAPGSDKHDPIKKETRLEISYLENDNKNMPEMVDALSAVIYESMPRVPYNQIIAQNMALLFIEKSEDFEKINIEALTDNKPIYFEFGKETTQGRHKYETDTKVLVKKYLDNFVKFEKLFKERPITSTHTTEDYVENMFLALLDMPSEDGIKELREEIEKRANWELYSSFISLIPYIGTDQAVKYTYDQILKLESERIHLYGLRLIATFPQYIENPTNELVQNLEGLLNVEDVKLTTLKNSRILSFASVVAKSALTGHMNEQNFEKYSNLYNEKVLNSEKYEDKMVYLLGLVNMAGMLSHDYMTGIITNTSLPANLRSLAIVGFKNYLKKDNPEKLVETFEKLLNNKEENFDLRVEALDLLLLSDLSEQQFQNILHMIKSESISDDIYSQHLVNYFLTSLESLQNSTAYVEPVSNMATAALATEKIPYHTRPWTTGNYRLSYSDPDPNLGGYFHARSIANPILNIPSTLQLSYNQFSRSFDFGVYSIYLKGKGPFEHFFKKNFFRNIKEDLTIPELIKIIKDNDFPKKVQGTDFHIEFVIFVDNRAVFSMYFNNETAPEIEPILGDLIDEFMTSTFTISYPLFDYIQFPSMVGTPISIKNDVQDVFKFSFTHNDLHYRSSWYYQTWLESYNPILDTTISSYKVHQAETSLDTKISASPKRFVFVWSNVNNTVNMIQENLIGSNVDGEEILKKHCKMCETDLEIPSSIYSTESIQSRKLFGFSFNYTREQWEQPFTYDYDDVIHEFIVNRTHQSNSDSFPFAKPLLAFIHGVKQLECLKPDISRTYRYSIPSHENGTITQIEVSMDVLKIFQDPLVNPQRNFTVEILTKALDKNEDDSENIYTTLKFQYESRSNYNHTDENGKEKVEFLQNFYISHKNSNNTGHKICASRELIFPALRTDKFSILLPEDTKEVLTVHDEQINNETEANEKSCYDENEPVFSLNSLYTTQEERNNKLRESNHYEKCLEESKGLKYTPPTQPCIRAFIESSRYDDITVHAKLREAPDDLKNDLVKYPVLTAKRTGNMKLQFEALVSIVGGIAGENEFLNWTSYYPYKIENPSASVYRDYDVISGFRKSCIITPKEITTFSGRHLENNGDKNQVGLVECLENPKRGVTFEKIGQTNIGFKFWSNENTVEASVQDGKLKVILNKEILTQSHLEKEIGVRFLDDDVILVADDKVSIYYNTEYLYIKSLTLYNSLITCGLCNEH